MKESSESVYDNCREMRVVWHHPKNSAFVASCLFSFPLKQWYIFSYAKSLSHFHLAEYPLFCNTERIHKSVGKMTPLIQKEGMSHLYGTHTVN